MSDTPETDAFRDSQFNDRVDEMDKLYDLAEKLERERDEATTKLERISSELQMWRDGNIMHENHKKELEEAERERDEARDRILKLTDHGLDLMDANRELKRKCRKAIAALREAIQFRDKTMSGYDLEEWMKAAGLKEEYK